MRIYVSGIQSEGQAVPAGNLTASNNPLRIGGHSTWGEFFAAQVDDVRIYNRLLNPVDARGLYELGVSAAVPLTVTRSGSAIVISWPAEATGYVLKSSPALPDGAWSDVPGVVNNSVTITPGPGNLFFRLQK